MVVNVIAESSFSGVTAQLQVFGRIGMASASDISDNQVMDSYTDLLQTRILVTREQVCFMICQMSCRSLLLCVQYRKLQLQDSQTPILWTDSVIPNKRGISWWIGKDWRSQQMNLFKCIIYRQMWDSGWCWNTSGEVKKKLELWSLISRRSQVQRTISKCRQQNWSDKINLPYIQTSRDRYIIAAICNSSGKSWNRLVLLSLISLFVVGRSKNPLLDCR